MKLKCKNGLNKRSYNVAFSQCYAPKEGLRIDIKTDGHMNPLQPADEVVMKDVLPTVEFILTDFSECKYKMISQ